MQLLLDEAKSKEGTSKAQEVAPSKDVQELQQLLVTREQAWCGEVEELRARLLLQSNEQQGKELTLKHVELQAQLDQSKSREQALLVQLQEREAEVGKADPNLILMQDQLDQATSREEALMVQLSEREEEVSSGGGWVGMAGLGLGAGGGVRVTWLACEREE